MRIWDVDPGYLSRLSLLGEHRELHAVVSIIRHGKTGYSRHPETLRWVGHGWALRMRHRLLSSEMRVRGYRELTPVRLRSEPGRWPEVFIDAPADQLAILWAKYRGVERGRIPLPRNAQQLWAQHKYSVMARDAAEYRRMGRRVASLKSGGEASGMYPDLVSLLRRPPDEGNLRNALEHMWGYVSRYAPSPGKPISGSTARRLLEEIRRLAFLHDVVYLKESTAISELLAWIR
jgi:hypothetical protein